MHGGSAGCPMASATSSATLWLCVALGILCTSYGRCYVHRNLWCTIVDVEPNNVHFYRNHPLSKARRRWSPKQPLAARVLFGAVTLVTLKIHMYPGGYCQTPVTPRIHRVLSGHRIRICSPLANASVKITKNSATSIEYENWDNIPWPHQILRRNYMKCVTGLSSRPDFFLNISNIIWWYHNQNIIKWE